MALPLAIVLDDELLAERGPVTLHGGSARVVGKGDDIDAAVRLRPAAVTADGSRESRTPVGPDLHVRTGSIRHVGQSQHFAGNRFTDACEDDGDFGGP